MSDLRKYNVRPLLRTVGGKPHATQDDHADSLPTPPSTNGKSPSGSTDNEDIFREPDDSDDEEPAKFTLPTTNLKDDAITINAATFAIPRQLDGTKEETSKPAAFKTPASLKRKSADADASEPFSSDGDDSMVFGDQSRKHQKILPNIHAIPVKQKGYGSKQRLSWQNGSARRSKATTATNSKTEGNALAKAEFKMSKAAGILESGKNEPLAQFRTPRLEADPGKERQGRPSSRSSSRSSLSDPPSEDEIVVVQHSLPKPRDYRPECAICGESVSVLLKEEFENQFTDGKTMLNYKWQQRFCRWHKEQDAKRVRDERGYTEIDWNRLERRMRRYHRHLKDVMRGSKASYYRNQLSEKIKERSKTTMQMLSDEGIKRGASVGYYGPRGERVMTEHIVNHLSNELVEQSSKDKLVAAAGVSGGVSGFVQAVLVPELAEQLVMEDLKVDSRKAREVIAENAELGELLYPDVDDKLAEVVEL